MTKRHEPSRYLPVPTEPPSMATRLRWEQQSRAKDGIALATENAQLIEELIEEQIEEFRQRASDPEDRQFVDQFVQEILQHLAWHLMAMEMGSRMPGVAVDDRLARPDRAQILRRIVSRANDAE